MYKSFFAKNYVFSCFNFFLTNLVFTLENYKKFQSSKQRAVDSKSCYSVKFEPLITREDELEVTEVFGFPALHCLLGIVNKLCECLEKVWPDFPKWPESLHLVKENYHGKCYEVRVQEHVKIKKKI